MNLLFAAGNIIFFLFCSSLQARPHELTPIPSFREQRLSNQQIYYESLLRSEQLLRSKNMDTTFSKALSEVLQNSIRKDLQLEEFKSIIEKLENDAKFRFEHQEAERLLHAYFKNIRRQAELFYELTQSAQLEQIDKFNDICANIMELLQTTADLELSLQQNSDLDNQQL